MNYDWPSYSNLKLKKNPNAILVCFLTFIKKIPNMVYIPPNWKTKTDSRISVTNGSRIEPGQVQNKCLTLLDTLYATYYMHITLMSTFPKEGNSTYFMSVKKQKLCSLQYTSMHAKCTKIYSHYNMHTLGADRLNTNLAQAGCQ